EWFGSLLGQSYHVPEQPTRPLQAATFLRWVVYQYARDRLPYDGLGYLKMQVLAQREVQLFHPRDRLQQQICSPNRQAARAQFVLGGLKTQARDLLRRRKRPK